jgi:hypothetical protein
VPGLYKPTLFDSIARGVGVRRYLPLLNNVTYVNRLRRSGDMMSSGKWRVGLKGKINFGTPPRRTGRIADFGFKKGEKLKCLKACITGETSAGGLPQR